MRHRGATSAWAWTLLVPISAWSAEPSPDTTRWLCRDNGRMELACRATAAPASHRVSADAIVALQGLPPLVRDIRLRPRAWRTRELLIPLFNQPIELDHTRHLAQAVLCGTSDRCTAVITDATAGGTIDWAEFADAHDPLLAQSD